MVNMNSAIAMAVAVLALLMMRSDGAPALSTVDALSSLTLAERKELQVVVFDGEMVQVVVIDDTPDEVPFVDAAEVFEDDLSLGTETVFETAVESDAQELVKSLPPNKYQDDTVQMSPCSLWTAWNEKQCISRRQFRSDFEKLGRRLARKGISKSQAEIFMNEYMLRLRNAWMPGTEGICSPNWLETAERTKCLVESDAQLMGQLLAAIAEEQPSTSSGRLRKNVENYALNSPKCCHRLCSVVSNLYTNTELIRSTCCAAAPSKCITYYN
mmetsp:Transcript_1693/g.4499  ORF Transcript_1693/g.4499 Transcript_1693/m.4499 type:complete len:270 (-) Transcript_1693:108-917(-)